MKPGIESHFFKERVQDAKADLAPGLHPLQVDNLPISRKSPILYLKIS